MQSYKIIILGNELTDKTKFCEIFTGTEGGFENDKCKTQFTVDGKEYLLEIVDTAGTEQFPAMRELYTKQADGIIYIYSSINQATFNDLTTYRQQVIEIKPEHMPNVIVGTHCDLEDQRVVSAEQGERLANQFSGHFFNVSTRLKININEVFIDLIRQMDEHNGNSVPQTKRRSTLFRLPKMLRKDKEKKKDKEKN